MLKEEVLAQIREKAPELLDRAVEYEDPVAAILDAWVAAREMRRAAAGHPSGGASQGLRAEAEEWRSLAELRCEVAEQERALLTAF